MFSVEPCDVPSVACCPSKPKVNHFRSVCCQCVRFLQFNIKVGIYSNPGNAPLFCPFLNTDIQYEAPSIHSLNVSVYQRISHSNRPTPPLAGRLSHVFGYALLRTFDLCVCCQPNASLPAYYHCLHCTTKGFLSSSDYHQFSRGLRPVSFRSDTSLFLPHRKPSHRGPVTTPPFWLSASHHWAQTTRRTLRPQSNHSCLVDRATRLSE